MKTMSKFRKLENVTSLKNNFSAQIFKYNIRKSSRKKMLSVQFGSLKDCMPKLMSRNNLTKKEFGDSLYPLFLKKLYPNEFKVRPSLP